MSRPLEGFKFESWVRVFGPIGFGFEGGGNWRFFIYYLQEKNRSLRCNIF